MSPDQTHPYRQAELIPELNKRLQTGSAVNSHDILSVRRVYGIDPTKRPEFVYQARWRGSSPQYSEEFVDWLADQTKADPEFFVKARAKFHECRSQGQPRRRSPLRQSLDTEKGWRTAASSSLAAFTMRPL